jgi:hypothetical protein
MQLPIGSNSGRMVDAGQRVIRDIQAGNATYGNMIDEVTGVGVDMLPPQYQIPAKTALKLVKAKAAQKQAQSNPNGPKTTKQKSNGKQSKSNKGKAAGFGKPEYNSTIPTSQPERSNSSFGRVASGSRVDLSSEMDNSTYKIPSKIQKETDDEQNSKTWIQMIAIGPESMYDVDSNPQIKVALDSIYYKNRSSVIDKTRGGTGSTAINLTKTNWINYIKHVTSGLAMLSEYYAIRTMNPHGDETNTVLSSMKDALNSASDTMIAAYRLDTLISELCIPPYILRYYQWLFQTYKKSPVTGGVQQRFMSTPMLKDYYEDDNTFARVGAAMDAVSDFILSNEYFPTISALMTQMTDYDWMMLDVSKVGGCEVEYDYYANSIFSNSPIRYFTDSGTVQVNINKLLGLEADGNTMLAAFPMDKTQVPILVTSALLLSFGTSATYCGFPFFKIGNNSLSSVDANGYSVVNDTTKDVGVAFKSCYRSSRQINDTNWLINDTRDNAIFLPRGMNTQQYALNFVSLSDATQEFLLDAFGVQR